MNIRILWKSGLVLIGLCAIATFASLLPARTAKADALGECLFWADVQWQQCVLNCGTTEGGGSGYQPCYQGCITQHNNFVAYCYANF